MPFNDGIFDAIVSIIQHHKNYGLRALIKLTLGKTTFVKLNNVNQDTLSTSVCFNHSLENTDYL